MNIKIGDLVCLKIAENVHRMTVGYVDAKENKVECWWYDEDLGEFKHFVFPSEILEIINDSPNDFSPIIGEEIQLKSGSATMKIASINADGKIKCVWFDKKNRTYKEENFVFNSLNLTPF
jgi:uncharacterized protein YodC (DUF2158 family)